MDGDAGRDTWRTDRPYPRTPRENAGTYFHFLDAAGYELSAIEQAVTDGVPYRGDHPDSDLTVDAHPAGAPDGPTHTGETPVA
jgi:ParB family chromosome partitioning protein